MGLSGVHPNGAPLQAGTRVRDAQEGSPPTFTEIYETHADLVWRTLRCSGVRRENVDDVAQEVFLSIHKNLASFQGRSSLRTWVYRVTRNAALNHHRSLSRRPDGGPDASADERPSNRPGPEQAASQKEALEELQEMLANLDENKREVLVLVELEGFSANEVATTLDIPVNTVSSRLRLARAEFNRIVKRREARTGAALD